ncbi:MAG TPA: hypothetical protein VN999_09320, partial [Thermoanaerobaculia bacterium]|nr:hypothetical protein [Thermoanaerobaculia bacterium]
RPEIDRTLETMKRLVATGGYVAFDVRNALNPFISSAYARHRRDGLQFFPASPCRVLRLFPTTEFEVIEQRPVGYASLAEAGVTERGILHRIGYAIYLRLTRNLLLSPYLLYILRRRRQRRSPSMRLA